MPADLSQSQIEAPAQNDDNKTEEFYNARESISVENNGEAVAVRESISVEMKVVGGGDDSGQVIDDYS